MTAEERATLWREDLLSRLGPAVRPRVENNRNYEDLVALLAAWLEATDEHLSGMEEKVVTRLTAELVPKGDWKFPVQSLAVPVDLRHRIISEDTPFQGTGGGDDHWRPCGEGWTRPTELGEWSAKPIIQTHYALICEIRAAKPDEKLLLPLEEAEPNEGQQLAYVCGGEALIAALANAEWGVQYPGERIWQAVNVTRYRDYFRFEQGIGAGRPRQKQIEAWLPPFYPYSRKFLRFSLTEPKTTRLGAAWERMDDSAKTIRLAAVIDADTANLLEEIRAEAVEAAQKPLILNAVPVAQMQVQAENLLKSPQSAGDSYLVPFTGIWGTFAATVRESRRSDAGQETVYHAAGLRTKPTDFAAIRQDEQSVEVRCGLPTGAAQEYQARLYFGCRGESVSPPRELFRGPQRFLTPFPALGGMDAPVMGYGDAGARHAWYQTYLRAPQATLGDIIEILSQNPTLKQWLVFDDTKMIQLDIENRPMASRTSWENYLWPTRISEETFLEMRASYLSASRVAILPRMRVHFQRRKQGLPAFLWEEMGRYAASVLSLYFMIGWYRLEGIVAE